MILLWASLSQATETSLCPTCTSVRFETHDSGWFGMHPKGQIRWIFIEDTEKQEAWIKMMKKRYWKSPFPKPHPETTAVNPDLESTDNLTSSFLDGSTTHNLLRSTDGKVCIQQHPSGLLLGAAQDGCSVLEKIEFPAPEKANTQPMLVQKNGCWVIQPASTRFIGGEVSYKDGMACFSVPPTKITVIEAAGTSSQWSWNDERGEFLLAKENSDGP